MDRHRRWRWCGALALLTLHAVFAPLVAQGTQAPALAAQRRLPRAVNRLPAQLADSTFWRLVTDLSEPGGWFRSENYVSNETAWQEVMPTLAHVVPSGHAYLGVGPEQNFTYLAALDPGVAFIVDIRRQNLALHLYYKALFELAPTRAEFLARLFARPLVSFDSTLWRGASIDTLLARLERTPPDSAWQATLLREVFTQLTVTHGFAVRDDDRALITRVAQAFVTAGPDINYSYVPEYGSFAMVTRGMPTFAALFRHHDGNGVNRSFLGREAAYARVRALQQRNLIVPVTGDFAGAHAVRAVGAWLRVHDATVGTFYLSNVEQYLFQENDVWPRFFANVATLPLDASSTFVRSVANRWNASVRGGPLMSQRLGPMQQTLEAVRAGRVLWYGDVIALERRPE